MYACLFGQFVFSHIIHIKSLHSFFVFALSLTTLIAALSHKDYYRSKIRRSSVDRIGSKMNHCNLQQNAFIMSGDDSMDSVVCPKPLRLLNHSQSGGVADVYDSKAEEDLLDIIRRKEESVTFVSSSPPFFLGSPPSRTSNPIAKDARFGDEKLNLVSPSLSPFIPVASRVKGGGGCGRIKYGVKPATVRVEGFDCLNRNRQNSSIPAMA